MTLHASGGQVRAHLAVLAAASPELDQWLEEAGLAAGDTAADVEVEGASAEAVSVVVGSVYGDAEPDGLDPGVAQEARQLQRKWGLGGANESAPPTSPGIAAEQSALSPGAAALSQGAAAAEPSSPQCDYSSWFAALWPVHEGTTQHDLLDMERRWPTLECDGDRLACAMLKYPTPREEYQRALGTWPGCGGEAVFRRLQCVARRLHGLALQSETAALHGNVAHAVGWKKFLESCHVTRKLKPQPARNQEQSGQRAAAFGQVARPRGGRPWRPGDGESSWARGLSARLRGRVPLAARGGGRRGRGAAQARGLESARTRGCAHSRVILRK